MTALKKTPIFKVTAPAFCASARVGSDAPFNVAKMLVKSMPPTSRPMSGVKMSFTKLLTTAVKATPMMMPTARFDHIAAHDESFEFIDPPGPADAERYCSSFAHDESPPPGHLTLLFCFKYLECRWRMVFQQ